jgi:hypothetical protein
MGALQTDKQYKEKAINEVNLKCPLLHSTLNDRDRECTATQSTPGNIHFLNNNLTFIYFPALHT